MLSVVDKIKELNADQTIALMHTIENVLGTACCCSVHKGEGAPVPFEIEMAELLLGKWASATTSVQKRIAEIFAAHGGALTDVEIIAILDAVDDILDVRFFQEIKQPLGYLFDDSYRDAKHGLAQRLQMVAQFDAIDTGVIKWLTEHHLYWIGKFYDKKVSGAFAKHVDEGLTEGLGRIEMSERVKIFFADYPGLSNKPDHYYRMLSANAMNRSRNYSLLQGYADAGIKNYQILAVMDERTSPICRKMNGTVISVNQGIAHRNLLMAAESPEDVKEIAPWPTLNQIETLSVDQLRIMGVAVPPFHANCRTTIIAE